VNMLNMPKTASAACCGSVSVSRSCCLTTSSRRTVCCSNWLMRMRIRPPLSTSFGCHVSIALVLLSALLSYKADTLLALICCGFSVQQVVGPTVNLQQVVEHSKYWKSK